MNYQTEYQTMRALCSPAIQPGLERIQALLDRLGRPERGLNVIHVGGTNGKGSVCALLEAILLAEGRNVGLYSSPHLHDFRERIRIGGAIITEDKAARLLGRLNEALRGLRDAGGPLPTEFEAGTALALLAFAAAKPEQVILEVGLGGAYDATNVGAAAMAVITNVGRDHMEYLGEEIGQIATEKAGIIKRGAQVFTAATGEAWQIIAEQAAREQASLQTLGNQLGYRLLSHSPAGQLLDIHTPQRSYPALELALLGAHQGENAALAVAAAEAAGAGEAAIRQGLRTARHAARLEILQQEPLILLDGAHNAPGMAALATALRDYWPGQRVLALIGMLADKEREQALEHLLPLLSGAVISRPPLIHRSGDWRRLAAVCAAGGLAVPPQNLIEDIPTACARALELLPEYDLLLVCGSLYLVAEARGWLLKRQQPEVLG